MTETDARQGTRVKCCSNRYNESRHATPAPPSLGASLLWTGQGNFLSINTSASSSARDAGLFWALYQLSGVLGNLAVYLLFR